MTDDEVYDLGVEQGLNMLIALGKRNATNGEILAVASFVMKGILLAVRIRSGQSMETIQEDFNKMLDIWLEQPKQTDKQPNS